jgi:formate/nitrite transporter FocA (FNT family)
MPLLDSIQQPTSETSSITAEHESKQQMILILATILSCNIFGLIILFFLFSIRELELNTCSERDKTIKAKKILRQNEITKKTVHDIFDDLKMSCG